MQEFHRMIDKMTLNDKNSFLKCIAPQTGEYLK